MRILNGVFRILFNVFFVLEQKANYWFLYETGFITSFSIFLFFYSSFSSCFILNSFKNIKTYYKNSDIAASIEVIVPFFYPSPVLSLKLLYLYSFASHHWFCPSLAVEFVELSIRRFLVWLLANNINSSSFILLSEWKL